LALFIFFFLLSQTLINFFAILQPGVLGYSSDISPQRIIELTNQERVKYDLAPLKMNKLLNEAAQRKAGDMILRKTFFPSRTILCPLLPC
jgi:hypothetical protein